MQSELGRRIRSADRVLREFKFSILVPVNELLGGACTDEVLLQGVVDCCIEENGGLTVIDYKTDYVTPETAEARAKEYRPQLSAYALAMERVTGKRVKESVLWFFSADKYVTVKNS